MESWVEWGGGNFLPALGSGALKRIQHLNCFCKGREGFSTSFSISFIRCGFLSMRASSLT